MGWRYEFILAAQSYMEADRLDAGRGPRALSVLLPPSGLCIHTEPWGSFRSVNNPRLHDHEPPDHLDPVIGSFLQGPKSQQGPETLPRPTTGLPVRRKYTSPLTQRQLLPWVHFSPPTAPRGWSQGPGRWSKVITTSQPRKLRPCGRRLRQHESLCLSALKSGKS